MLDELNIVKIVKTLRNLNILLNYQNLDEKIKF